MNQMKPDVILVSDQSEQLATTCRFLCRCQVNVLCVENICEARAGLLLHSPAFLLLDFDIDGAYYLLQEIAYKDSFSPTYIMVAAPFSSGEERAAMFRRGADACVEKPINAEEILAIMEAVRRREERTIHHSSNHDRIQIKYKELVIDALHRSVTMRGTPIVLTRKEYDILYTLATHIGNVMTKEEIYTTVWKDNYTPKMTNVSDQISSLRRKLGLSSKDTGYIQTVIGVGYRFGTLM